MNEATWFRTRILARVTEYSCFENKFAPGYAVGTGFYEMPGNVVSPNECWQKCNDDVYNFAYNGVTVSKVSPNRFNCFCVIEMRSVLPSSEYISCILYEILPINDDIVKMICNEKLNNNVKFEDILKQYFYINQNQLRHAYENACTGKEKLLKNDYRVCQLKFIGLSIDWVLRELKYFTPSNIKEVYNKCDKETTEICELQEKGMKPEEILKKIQRTTLKKIEEIMSGCFYSMNENDIRYVCQLKKDGESVSSIHKIYFPTVTEMYLQNVYDQCRVITEEIIPKIITPEERGEVHTKVEGIHTEERNLELAREKLLNSRRKKYKHLQDKK